MNRSPEAQSESIALTDAADPEAGGAHPARPAALGLALRTGEADAGPAVVGRVAGAVRELHHVEQAQNCKARVPGYVSELEVLLMCRYRYSFVVTKINMSFVFCINLG